MRLMVAASCAFTSSMQALTAVLKWKRAMSSVTRRIVCVGLAQQGAIGGA